MLVAGSVRVVRRHLHHTRDQFDAAKLILGGPFASANAGIAVFVVDNRAGVVTYELTDAQHRLRRGHGPASSRRVVDPSLDVATRRYQASAHPPAPER